MQRIAEFWFGLPDWVRRPFRTFVQAFAGVFVLAIIALIGDVQAGDVAFGEAFNVIQAAAVSAALAGAAAVASFFQNWIEEARGVAR